MEKICADFSLHVTKYTCTKLLFLKSTFQVSNSVKPTNNQTIATKKFHSYMKLLNLVHLWSLLLRQTQADTYSKEAEN